MRRRKQKHKMYKQKGETKKSIKRSKRTKTAPLTCSAHVQSELGVYTAAYLKA